MATAPCPPHSTVQSAITSNSWKSCRPALPVRGSSRPSQQAMNRSKPSSHAIRLLRRKVESISPEPGKPSLECQGDSKCESPDFITNAIDVRLDLLYLLPGRPLPPVIPDHDVAFFAISEADAPTLARLQRLFDAWPRPALDNPRFLPILARDMLARPRAGIPAILSPPTITVRHAALAAHLADGRPLGISYPCLIRPVGSHAGTGLVRAEGPADLAAYLRRT